MPGTVNLSRPIVVDSRRPDSRWGRLLRRLWPAHCLLCGAAGDRGLDLCAACAARLPWNHSACLRCAIPLPPLAGVPRSEAPRQLCGACLRRPPPQATCTAAFAYGFPLDRLLPRLKFHGDLAAARLLATLMAQACAGAERPDALVPLPLHVIRLRERGYDQALELARPLAQALELPLRTDLLRRQRATAPQSRLDATQRRRNLRDAFALPLDADPPQHVALVDDVMTTGATVHAAAQALRRAGVARVDAWVCARVP